jgi:hypothetical protein
MPIIIGGVGEMDHLLGAHPNSAIYGNNIWRVASIVSCLLLLNLSRV